MTKLRVHNLGFIGYSSAMTSPEKLLVAALTLALVSCSGPGRGLSEEERFFVNNVKPILEQNCLACHTTTTNPSRLNLSTPEALHGARGGKRFIVSGHPEQSLLIAAVSRKGGHPQVMPAMDLSLTEDQIAVLREWIQGGANWPSGPEGRLVPKANPER